MQRPCCGMRTSLFPTRRIKSIGPVRTSCALSPPCLFCPFLIQTINFFFLPYLALHLPYPASFSLLPCPFVSITLSNCRPAFSAQGPTCPNFVHLLSLISLLLYFLAIVLSFSWSASALGQIPFSEIYPFFVRIAVFFDPAAPLRFPISMGILGSQFGMRTLSMLPIFKASDSSFNPLVDAI